MMMINPTLQASAELVLDAARGRHAHVSVPTVFMPTVAMPTVFMPMHLREFRISDAQFSPVMTSFAFGDTNIGGTNSAIGDFGGNPSGIADACDDVRSFTTGTWAYAATSKKEHSQRKRPT